MCHLSVQQGCGTVRALIGRLVRILPKIRARDGIYEDQADLEGLSSARRAISLSLVVVLALILIRVCLLPRSSQVVIDTLTRLGA